MHSLRNLGLAQALKRVSRYVAGACLLVYSRVDLIAVWEGRLG